MLRQCRHARSIQRRGSSALWHRAGCGIRGQVLGTGAVPVLAPVQRTPSLLSLPRSYIAGDSFYKENQRDGFGFRSGQQTTRSLLFVDC